MKKWNREDDLRNLNRSLYERFQPRGFIKNNVGKILGPALFVVSLVITLITILLK